MNTKSLCWTTRKNAVGKSIGFVVIFSRVLAVGLAWALGSGFRGERAVF